MNKICGYTCKHNKGGVCQITMCDKKIVMTTTTNEPFEKRFNVKYDKQEIEKFTCWLDYTIEEYKEEIDRLNNIINELEKWLNENWNKPLAKIYVADVVKKISELKEDK